MVIGAFGAHSRGVALLAVGKHAGAGVTGHGLFIVPFLAFGAVEVGHALGAVGDQLRTGKAGVVEVVVGGKVVGGGAGETGGCG